MLKSSLSKYLSLIMVLVICLQILHTDNAVAADYTITSSDPRVQIFEDRISVASDPADERYSINSEQLLSFLSANGDCTISYTDENKNEVYSSNVRDGYIRILDGDGTESYIPVSYKGKTLADGFNRNYYVSTRGGSAVSYNQYSLGGKAEGDSAFAFSTSSSPNTEFDRIECSVSDRSIAYTYVFNVYADGDSEARINYAYSDDSYILFKWLKDGSFYYNSTGVGETTGGLVYGGTLERNRWHRIAFVYDAPRLRYHVYVDGVFYTNNSNVTGASTAKKFLFGIEKGSTDGMVAYDDLEGYVGYYYPDEYSINYTGAAGKAAFDLNARKVYYDSEIIHDAETLENELQRNADLSYVTIYTDDTFTTRANHIDENAVVVACSDQKKYMYFNISDDISADVSLAEQGGIVTARCDSRLGDRVLILAAYDGNKLADISLAPISSPGSFSCSIFADSDYIYKSFVRKMDFVSAVSDVSGVFDTTPRSEKCDERSVYVADFEKHIPMYVHDNGSTLELTRDSDKGVLLIERTYPKAFHITTPGADSYSDELVYEFDIKLLKSTGNFNIYFKDANGKFYTPTTVEDGYFKYLYFKSDINDNKYHKIAYCINFKTKSLTLYVDGSVFARGTVDEAFAKNGGRGVCLRFQVPEFKNYSASSEQEQIKCLVDNIKIYESDIPLDDIGYPENVIETGGMTVFEDLNYTADIPEDGFAIHCASGILAYDDTKYALVNKPYEENGKLYVHSDEILQIIGKNVNVRGYVDVQTFADTLSMQCVSDKSALNGGVYVFTQQDFSLPSDSDLLQAFNNYFFFERPSAEEVYDTYKSYSSYKKHPRIHATRRDFEVLKNSLSQNEYMRKWYIQIIDKADSLIGAKAIEYIIDDRGILLSQCRKMLTNMYILGMAYQMTGDDKYAMQAWVDLKNVCVNFPDWHPSHDIDLGEMCAAVAVGYDWMYDAFSPEIRSMIEKGMYKFGLYEAALCYQYNTCQMQSSPTGGANHNVVCSGGIIMAALAFMDAYPDECSYLLSNALRALERVLPSFDTDGAWFEGPHYWEYTIQYTTKALSSMRSSLGTTFSLQYIDGISAAADFMVYMQSSNGIFNYGDGGMAKIYVPEMLWLSNMYDNPGVTAVFVNETQGNISNFEDLVLSLLWFDPDKQSITGDFPIDKLYAGEDTLTMRQSWERGSSFVGIHAGVTNVTHSHLDGGSFVYDHGGIRWAIDPGSGNYDHPEYFDSSDDGNRWRVFMCRAESHNTIVVNPSELPDHIPSSYAALRAKNLGGDNPVAIVDTTGLLRDVNSARRGFLYTDNRNTLVIRDEVNLSKQSDVCWFMQTYADVEIDSKGATLTQDGKKLRLDFVTNGDASIEVTNGKPLPESPIEPGDGYGDFNRIVIRSKGSGELNITVKLTPDGVSSSPVSDYDKSIDLW